MAAAVDATRGPLEVTCKERPTVLHRPPAPAGMWSAQDGCSYKPVLTEEHPGHPAVQSGRCQEPCRAPSGLTANPARSRGRCHNGSSLQAGSQGRLLTDARHCPLGSPSSEDKPTASTLHVLLRESNPAGPCCNAHGSHRAARGKAEPAHWNASFTSNHTQSTH